jgi:MraZ protein
MEPSTQVPTFAGEFRHAMDAKNRVTIPARWRRGGDVDEFFAIPDLETGFLMMMPPEVFRGVAAKVEGDERVSPQERRKFVRQFYARAQHVTTDRQGRLVVPEEHCRQLNLRGEVVLVGNHSRFEIWSPDTWRRTMEEDTPTFNHVMGIVGL